VKLAILLFNLGGPDSPEAVEPFLRNLFSDPAIITLPWIIRKPLAAVIARRRAPVAKEIYDHIGGRSPILEETQKQACALEAALNGPDCHARAFVAMRCWHPFSDATALAVRNFDPDHIVALPLYPQHSTTTTASSFKDWDRAAKKASLNQPFTRICCYPGQPGFIAAMAEKIRAAMAGAHPDLSYRLLLSAHGLPKKTVASGDPYQWQVEQTARALVDALGINGLTSAIKDWRVCYQSRVGPLQWLEPATNAEIARAGREGLGLIVAPIAFVSEHSETLVELDIEYEKLARRAGVPDYRRTATVGADPVFIAGLADLVRRAASVTGTINNSDGRLCPAQFCHCGFEQKA
jgi:ferrochelatase